MDYNDERHKGRWYPKELQDISDNYDRITKVYQSRTLPDGTNKLVVRWEGWPDNYNS